MSDKHQGGLRRSGSCMLCGGVIIGTIAAGTAHALPLTFVRAGALAAGDFATGQNNDSGILTGPLAIEDAAAVGQSASGSSTLGDSGAVASRGTLGAKAEAESVLAAGPDARAVATAGALAAFGDSVTFHAPPGASAISVRFVLHLEGTVSPSCAGGSCRLDAFGQLLNGSSFRIMPEVDVVYDSGDPLGAMLPPQTVTQEFVFSDGARLDFIDQLGVSVSADGLAGGDADSITGDFLATETFRIDVLTPGGSYTTASGVSYSTTPPPAPIPEPSTLLLMTLGVAVLFAEGRRPAAR